MAKNEPLPPAVIRRVSIAVAANLLAAPYGTPIGLMFLAGELSQGQYDACLWFRQLRAAYDRAIGARPLRAQDLSGEGRSSPADPDTARGRRQARAEASAVASYDSAKLAGSAKGVDKFCLFEAVVMEDHILERWEKPKVCEVAALLLRHRELGRRMAQRLRRST